MLVGVEKSLGQIARLETKIKLEWCKHAFECKHNSLYGIENRNDIMHINDNEVNKFLNEIYHTI